MALKKYQPKKVVRPTAQLERSGDPSDAAARMMVIDRHVDDPQSVELSGWKLSSGTLGVSVNVQKSAAIASVLADSANLPALEEQDCIVLETAPSSVFAHHSKAQVTVGVVQWLTSSQHGVISSKELNLNQKKEAFGRFVTSGGILVVLATPRQEVNYTRGRVRQGIIRDSTDCICDNWSALEDLSPRRLRVESRDGDTVELAGSKGEISTELGELIQASAYSCVLLPRPTLSARWSTIAHNRRGEAVAGWILDETGRRAVLVLPRVRDFQRLLQVLATRDLPSLLPQRFPDRSPDAWSQREPYELHAIAALEAQKLQIQRLAEKQLADVDHKIALAREADGWQYDLIRGSDTELVAAVRTCIDQLGLAGLVDVDDQLAANAGSKVRREDLHKKGRDRAIVIDVKGLNALPTDPDMLQAAKHAKMRSLEWGYPVHALMVINHQRGQEPLMRDNKSPFRKEFLDTAHEWGTGLITTWDLLRLYRGMQRWKWSPASVVATLYNVGRLHAIPDSYEPTGRITESLNKQSVVVVNVSGPLSVGDGIAVQTALYPHQARVLSIQVNGQDVKQAVAGTKVGLKVSEWNDALCVAAELFRIKPSV